MNLSPQSATRSEDENPDDRPRKRTVRACDSCYKRKIKCDAAVRQCNWCSHHNIPCTFTRSTQRRRKDRNNTTGQRTTQLADRISRIEKLLTENLLHEAGTPSSQPGASSKGSPSQSELDAMSNFTPSQFPVSSSVPLHFAGREFGVISLITGIPFLLPEGQQWVQSRTGQMIAFDKLSPARPPWEKHRVMSSNSLLMNQHVHDAFELPPPSVVQAYFETYRSSLMQRIFPVVDPILFSETITSAYQSPSSNQYGQASAKACVFAFIAFACLLHTCDSDYSSVSLPTVDSETLLTKAKCLLPQFMQETTSLDGLQCVTMLALFELVSGNIRLAGYFTSLATRFIFILGAHVSHQSPAFPALLPATQDPRTQWHLRNIFWLCYTIDKDIALRTGQPPMFSDDNCDLTLPPGYIDKLYSSMEYHHHSQELPEYPIFPVDLRLSIIKSRAHSALYSLKALQKSDAELLREIRELDDELEKWRLSVPLEWRPTMSFSQETPDPNMSMHSVMLRLNYHLCMTIIHQASSRCKAWAKGQSGVMEGISSSLTLSVEASRSTLLYLEAAEHVLVDGVFWILIFYPMSALLSIFCNILQNPLHPQAAKDLALLHTTTGIMERIFLRQLPSLNEIVHIKLIADFVTELNRLGQCAIDKAWRERSVG